MKSARPSTGERRGSDGKARGEARPSAVQATGDADPMLIRRSQLGLRSSLLALGYSCLVVALIRSAVSQACCLTFVCVIIHLPNPGNEWVYCIYNRSRNLPTVSLQTL